MKYLFFDTECANGYVESSKICSFGYIIIDENFNILKQEDILINPAGRFKLIGRKHRADCHLTYDETVFRKQEKFHKYYNVIKELLEDKETIVIGYSTDSDVRFILTELLYYELKPINFEYYDVQKIFNKIYGFNFQVSLRDAAILLDQYCNIETHNSLNDAILTMKVLKKCIEEKNSTISLLLEEYNNTKESFENYRLSVDLNKCKSNKWIEKRIKIMEEKKENEFNLSLGNVFSNFFNSIIN